ncbi:hypothetical protein B0H16DRAFT_1879531 [Mycena metata]|uniref:Uncharacterized protein n=1 Tax=Mycena metata TaxID=1033252 RepID=A0AAD7NUW9_9AGAR|nr:hypothetical protein B0H16DRAFT_1879531 [Mycena metata]
MAICRRVPLLVRTLPRWVPIPPFRNGRIFFDRTHLHGPTLDVGRQEPKLHALNRLREYLIRKFRDNGSTAAQRPRVCARTRIPRGTPHPPLLLRVGSTPSFPACPAPVISYLLEPALKDAISLCMVYDGGGECIAYTWSAVECGSRSSVDGSISSLSSPPRPAVPVAFFPAARSESLHSAFHHRTLRIIGIILPSPLSPSLVALSVGYHASTGTFFIRPQARLALDNFDDRRSGEAFSAAAALSEFPAMQRYRRDG